MSVPSNGHPLRIFRYFVRLRTIKNVQKSINLKISLIEVVYKILQLASHYSRFFLKKWEKQTKMKMVKKILRKCNREWLRSSSMSCFLYDCEYKIIKDWNQKWHNKLKICFSTHLQTSVVIGFREQSETTTGI